MHKSFQPFFPLCIIVISNWNSSLCNVPGRCAQRSFVLVDFCTCRNFTTRSVNFSIQLSKYRNPFISFILTITRRDQTLLTVPSAKTYQTPLILSDRSKFTRWTTNRLNLNWEIYNSGAIFTCLFFIFSFEDKIFRIVVKLSNNVSPHWRVVKFETQH